MTPKKRDYYDMLGVSKSASPDEIKQAFRKLAMIHHPDRGGDPEKFKEINEAYQVLSDSKKRAQYDQFGSADVGAGGSNWQGAGSASQNWDFRDFGGFGDIFETVFGQAFSQVQTELHISLTQAILGDKIELQTSNRDNITLNVPSGTADGTTFRFRGKGQPYRRGRGDLLITVRVKLPRKLSRQQKELFEELKNTGL